MDDLYLFVFEAAANQVILELDACNYTANLGDAVKLTCTGLNLQLADLVWQIYPQGQPMTTTVIFLTGKQVVFGDLNDVEYDSPKYSVDMEQTSVNSVRSTLTIANLDLTDAGYVYQCACNIYTACAAGRKVSAIANLTVVPIRSPKSDTTTSRGGAFIYIFN